MVRTAQWKLIDNSMHSSADFELYDMRNDPREERNLAGDPKHKDLIADFCRQLTKWRAERPAPAKVSGMATPGYAFVSDKEREELMASAPDDQE